MKEGKKGRKKKGKKERKKERKNERVWRFVFFRIVSGLLLNRHNTTIYIFWSKAAQSNCSRSFA